MQSCRKIRRVTKFAPVYRILVLINFFVGEEAHRVQRVKNKLGIWKTQATDLVSCVLKLINNSLRKYKGN